MGGCHSLTIGWLGSRGNCYGVNATGEKKKKGTTWEKITKKQNTQEETSK